MSAAWLSLSSACWDPASQRSADISPARPGALALMLPSAAPSATAEDLVPSRSEAVTADKTMTAVYKQAKATSYPCRVCGLILPSSQSLGGHLSRVHSGSRDASRQKPKQSLKKSRFHSSESQHEESEGRNKRRRSTSQLNTSDPGEPDESQDDSYETNTFATGTEANKSGRTRPTNNQLL